ncbi:unnamed protein product [Didymodactylos carnosus]|uniref:Major facilitator superfamily (MFS) profile domain-containing protein n=1 Tax=Didymodactylos carnosus TaxID=1234261 RepID=A0A8S2I206_9BILA|nr:unnamed protein product [Didymodactylos carnosus]CAF3709945.1 unnamed protein product [Didymodactylos carnosus]
MKCYKIWFGLLALNQLAAGLTATSYSIIFILMLELSSSRHTSLVGNSALVSFTLGEALQTLFAYLSKNWQLLKWINLTFIALGLPYLYFMPESPYFLYSKKEYHKLEQLLRQIAQINQRQESDWYPYYQELLKTTSLRVLQQKKLSYIQ